MSTGLRLPASDEGSNTRYVFQASCGSAKLLLRCVVVKEEPFILVDNFHCCRFFLIIFHLRNQLFFFFSNKYSIHYQHFTSPYTLFFLIFPKPSFIHLLFSLFLFFDPLLKTSISLFLHTLLLQVIHHIILHNFHLNYFLYISLLLYLHFLFYSYLYILYSLYFFTFFLFYSLSFLHLLHFPFFYIFPLFLFFFSFFFSLLYFLFCD